MGDAPKVVPTPPAASARELELARRVAELEDALRTADVLDALVENSQDQLVFLDTDFNFVRVNRAYAETCHRSADDLIGRNHFELYPHAENQAIFERVRDTGQPAVWREKPFVFPDQPERGVTYWDWTLTPTYDRTGNVSGLVFSLQDVTEKVRARQSIAESERRYRDLFTSMTEGFAVHEIVCDPAGTPVDYRFLSVNPAFERLTGLHADDVTGRLFSEVLGNEDSSWIRIYGDVAITGRPVHFENYSVRLGRHYEVVAFRPAERQFATFFMDVTSRRKAQESLEIALTAAQAGRETLRALMEHVPEGITIADAPDGRIRMVSRFGEELLGRTFHGMTVGEAADKFGIFASDGTTPMPPGQTPLARSLRGEVVRDAVMVQATASGTRLHLLCNASPIRGRGGEVTGGVVVWRDISAIQRTQADLRRSEADLREADRRKSQFLALLSHELRNPLTPIGNSLNVLARAAPDSPMADRARAVIERQYRHLTRLVDDLLDVTRISSGKTQIRRVPLELGALLQRAVEDHEAGFAEAGVSLGLEPSPTPLWVLGDETRLSQVVGNVLVNAAKFTPRGGSAVVRVATDPSTGEAVVRVADSGAGMDASTLAHLFEPFAQADTTLDRSRGGLGLGLALVRGLMDLHGGTVRARSPGTGLGSELELRLPLTTEPAHPSPSRGVVSSPPASSPRRVLVIEDNVDAADSLRELLELSGHEVAVAYGGREGLALARELRPDVVLCDLGLPGLDGFAVARALRSDPELARTQLVALSGYALPADVARATEAGFDRHLAKPPTLAELREVLATSG